jgi:fibronectin type 3 domain-containing protein
LAQVESRQDSDLHVLSRESQLLAVVPDVAGVDEAPEIIDADAGLGLSDFKNKFAGRWSAQLDRRTGRIASLDGSGVAFFPGVGNQLRAQDVAAFLSGKTTPDLAAFDRRARAFLPDIAKAFGVKPSDLSLNLSRSGNVAAHVWFIDYDLTIDGFLVEGARLVLTVNNGNLISVGSEYLPVPGTQAPIVRVEAPEARRALERYVGGFLSTDTFSENGTFHVLPANNIDTRFEEGFEPGKGRGIVGVWQFTFNRPGQVGTFRARVDATSGELLEFVDVNEYGSATGGTYQSDRPASERVLPLPFANVATGVYTNSAGIFTGTTGTTTLNGQYVKIFDLSCGAISKAADASGVLALGSSSGTDCTTPGSGGAGNTHAARTQFYNVNRAMEVARGWLPSNPWLNKQVTANVNLNGSCDAYWSPSTLTLNFFKSGGGCANTGELPGVSLHEYGHGLDANDGPGSSPDYGTGETYGDFTAALSTHASCIGAGFLASKCGGYGNACSSCTGVRDIDWAKRSRNTPSTVDNFTRTTCDFPTPSKPTYVGVCGKDAIARGVSWNKREGHCESYVSSEALWDLANRDMPNPGTRASWTVVDRLWYLSRPTATAAFTCDTSASYLRDGTFEGLNSFWWIRSGAVYPSTNRKRSGSYGFDLGGTNGASGAMYQEFTIPSTATGTLTFWINTTSAEITTTTKYDLLYVEVRNTLGTLLATLATYSNLDQTTLGKYSQKSLSLAAYKGQTVRLQFRVKTNSTNPTTFSIDDLSIGTWKSDGCNIGNLFKIFRAVDDDNGNLADGTPHGGAIFAAMNRHGIACTTDAGASTTFAAVAPPAVPTLSATPGNNSVSLSWSGSSGVYDVYRNETGCNAGFTKVKNDNATTSYADTAVANGIAYCYQVVAQPSGNEAAASAPSTCQTVTPVSGACTPPVAPTGLAATAASSSQINLSWTASSGATSYAILRSTTSGGPYSSVGTATTTSFSNTGLAASTTYYYVVTASNGTCSSGNSAQASATTQAGSSNVLSNGVPVSGISGATGNQQTWTMAVPSGATNLSFVISGGTGDADMYVKFGSAPTTTTYDCRPYLSGNNEACSFATPSAGTYYVMLNGYAAYSGVSLTGSYSTSTCTPPAAPTGLTASGVSSSQINLSWTASSGATSYTVSRSTTSGGPYSSVGTATTTTFSNTGLAASTTYYYVVSASNGTCASGNSAQASAATSAVSNVLQNGVPVTGISGASGSQQTWTMSVPSGASNLSFVTSGGTGDADLFVKFGAPVTTGNFDCASAYSGNAESCTFAAPQAGIYYVMLLGYTAYAGASLTGSYSTGACTPPAAPTSLTATASSSSQINLNWLAPAGATSYTILRSTVSGGPYSSVGTATTASFSNTGLAASTTYFYVVKASNGTCTSGNSTQASATTFSSGSTQLVTNGGFEVSSSPWVFSGNAYWTNSSSYPRSGTGYSYLSNVNYATGAAYQQISIPSTATGSLTFWLNTTSYETTTTTKFDYLYVEVRNTAGSLLATLATYSNLDKTTAGNYVQKSLSLANYRGQTIRLQFRATTDYADYTTFRIDDVSLK